MSSHRELAARYPDLDERERTWEKTLTLAFTQAQEADVRAGVRPAAGETDAAPAPRRWSS